MKKTISLLSILSTCLSLCSCQVKKDENIIYTSIYPIYDFTKRIVGDKFEVKIITPYGSEPHDYEPKAKEIVEITSSKAVFLNSLGMESYEESLKNTMKEKVHVVTSDIDVLKINNTIDPHCWLSFENAKIEMSNILSIMKEIDEENYEYYKNRYEEEIIAFSNLQSEFEEKLKDVSSRYLVVAHAAFGYLCQEFHLEQIYVSGLSPDSEPTPKELEDIIKKIKEYNVKTIFFEELNSDKIPSKIAQETNVKMEELDPLEGIKEEDIGKKDYLSVMRDNLDKIVEALND